MKLKTIVNPNKIKRAEIAKAVKDNSGYCPCVIQKSPESKCPCKNFREQDREGMCHCGLYLKVWVDEES